MAQIIDGKKISQDIKDELKEKVTALKDTGTEVALAVIQVGNDPASSVYVRNKKKACEYIGIRSLSYELPEETTEDALIELIEKLNKDETVNGILVQLPVPKHIDPIAMTTTTAATQPKTIHGVCFFFLWCPSAFFFWFSVSSDDVSLDASSVKRAFR